MRSGGLIDAGYCERADPDEGYCAKSPDKQHCSCWWDCVPCCYCGHDSGGEADCDCERHTAGKTA